MTPVLTSVGLLSPAQVASVLRAAVLAPSTRNTRPWRFQCTPATIELHADARRALPVADPDQRELLLSCGAALFNLRIAIDALGIDPVTTLFPRRDQPGLLAVVRPNSAKTPDSRAGKLAAAIPHRHTNRRPFDPTPVPPASLAKLRQATETEHAWLPALDTDQRERLHKLVLMAHRIQIADPAFLAEWNRWTDRDHISSGGVPAHAAGTTPEDPLIVVVGTFEDHPADWLRAGQAMERVLLTATGAGLDASFLSQPIEVPVIRAELRQLLGSGLWPQIVLRIGYGGPDPDHFPG